MEKSCHFRNEKLKKNTNKKPATTLTLGKQNLSWMHHIENISIVLSVPSPL